MSTKQKQRVASGVKRKRKKGVGVPIVEGMLKIDGADFILVSQAESGRARVNERYVAAVLKACKLRRTWGLPRGAGTEGPQRTQEIAGIDPETAEVVMCGTKRDRELGQKYAWWNNRVTFG